MNAQTVWNVWRRILKEGDFKDYLFTSSSSALAKRFALNEEELEIAKAYAANPQRTLLFITNYRFRLTNSFTNALNIGAPLTLRALIAQEISINTVAKQFFDTIVWHDYGPNVLTLCDAALRFIKDNVIIDGIEGLSSLIDLEAASVSLIRQMASKSEINPNMLSTKQDKISLNSNNIVVTTSHTLTPWLKNKSLLGRSKLKLTPQHFLIYIPALDKAYKVAGLSQRGVQLLKVLTKLMTRKELNNQLNSAGFSLLRPEDDLIISRLLSYNVISIEPNFFDS